jgi:flagellar protein FlbT
MRIHLRKGEKIYINGAVLKIDRRASIELLNDASFLLESHILQADEAISPVQQLYFIAQTMLLDPESSAASFELYRIASRRLQSAELPEDKAAALTAAEGRIAAGRVFDGMRMLRGLFLSDAGGNGLAEARS